MILSTLLLSFLSNRPCSLVTFCQIETITAIQAIDLNILPFSLKYATALNDSDSHSKSVPNDNYKPRTGI
jgi:hypothetical protein